MGASGQSDQGLSLIDREAGGFARYLSDRRRPELASVDLPDFADLIKPHTVAEFADNFFLKLAMHAPGEGISRLPFFNLDRVRTLLHSQRGQDGNSSFRIDANFRNNPDDALFAVEEGQVGHLLDAGATVCLTAVHLVDPALSRLVARFKAQLSFVGRIGVNCYISGPGAGFRLHFDSKAAFVVQLQGSKRWRFERRSGFPFPRRSGRVDQSGEVRLEGGHMSEELWEKTRTLARETLSEVVLKPGDVLCLPPGALHEAEAGDDSSLALTIGFQPVSPWEIFNALLAKEFRESQAWRAGIPVLPNRPPQAAPNAVLSYLEERTKDLQDFVASITPNDQRLADAWYSSISTEPIARPVVPTDWLSSATFVMLLESGTASLHFYRSGDEARISLYHFGLKLTFSAKARSILVDLVDGKSIAPNAKTTSTADLCVLKVLAERQLLCPSSN